MRISKYYKSFFVCCAFLLLIGLSACENNASGSSRGVWFTGFTQNEESTGSAVGYHPPGRVYVTIKLENGFIRIVEIDGRHESLQTLILSQRANSIRNMIENRNSFEGINRADVHGGTGATVTFNAILNAGRDALESLKE